MFFRQSNFLFLDMISDVRKEDNQIIDRNNNHSLKTNEPVKDTVY